MCFDKALPPSSAVFSDPTEMHLVGYSSFTNFIDPIGATLVTSNNDCVNLSFNTHSGTLDLGQFTAVAIAGGAVTAGGQPNLADSVTLSTSTTHNGTSGLSTGPDLVGPAPVSSPANSIAFVFDQSIEPASLTLKGTPQAFWYENAAVNFCFSTAATQANPTTIIATFPTAVSGTCNDTTLPAPSVANARRAGVNGNALFNVSDVPVANAPQGTNMPNAANGGATNIASLLSATLDTSSGDKVTFNFDHALNAPSITDPTKFHVLLANGIDETGDAVSPAGGHSVIVTFDGMNLFDEYAIQAFVDQTAVQATPATSGCSSNVSPCPGPSTYTNTPGAVPIGGNSGAFARGFTTAPDVYMVSFNTTTNVATVFLDRRPASAPGGVNGINLIDAAGNVVGHPTSIAIPTFPNPGPVALTMDVNPAVIALSPVQIQLVGSISDSGVGGFCEVVAFLGGDGCSVPQIVQQTGSGVRIKAVKHVSKHHKRHAARKTHKRA